jgi:hypothetical protein
MGKQAKLIRRTIRITKLLRNKWKLKSRLATVILPGINILPVLPTLSIVHVQSTTVHSETQPMPSTDQDEPQHDATCPELNLNQVGNAEDHQNAVTTNDDILTQSKFFEVT